MHPARLGPYEVLEELGSGGMGTVYRAHDARLGRDVAIKLLHPEYAADSGRLARFRREARAVAALSHPNIITVHSVEELDGVPFLTMELLEGATLESMLPASGLARGRFLHYLRPVCAALAAAHAKGIVHRDLKPANIMVTADGRVKVLDFGLAKRMPAAALDSERDQTLTADGQIMGTVAYMSPEQLMGLPVDHRSDLFSLGVLLYQAATGSNPYQREYPAETISSVLRDAPPPLTDRRPDLGPTLSNAVLHCLAKRPEDRADSAEAICEALDAAAYESSASAAGAGGAPAPVASRRYQPLRQEIHSCTTPEGVRLAYGVVGDGPPLVKAANWLNHLEFDWESPVWRHLISALARDHLLVRYDERGNGLSDWDVDEISLEVFVRDLETVADAAGLERFALLGISQGGAVSIAYALRHPERVSHLVLHGGYPRGWRRRGTPEDIARREALSTLMRHGWGEESPAFREVFTALYLPEGTDEQKRWFNDLQRVSTSPENAVRLWDAIGDIDVTEQLAEVGTPTLVLHSRRDGIVPFAMGVELAEKIPHAQLVGLNSPNHIVLEQEPAWPVFLREIQRFLAS